MSKEFYTAQELADKLRVNVMTIYRYIDKGKLKAYKLGKEFRIDKDEFDSFLRKSKIKKQYERAKQEDTTRRTRIKT